MRCRSRCGTWRSTGRTPEWRAGQASATGLAEPQLSPLRLNSFRASGGRHMRQTTRSKRSVTAAARPARPENCLRPVPAHAARRDARAAQPGAPWTGIRRGSASACSKRRGRGGADHRADPADRCGRCRFWSRSRGHGAGRGMRMGDAPLLALWIPRGAQGIRRHRGHRHPVPGLRPAALERELGFDQHRRHRHALLRQHHDEHVPRVPGSAVAGPVTITYWSSATSSMVERASTMAGTGEPVPAIADLASCRRIFFR